MHLNNVLDSGNSYENPVSETLISYYISKTTALLHLALQSRAIDFCDSDQVQRCKLCVSVFCLGFRVLFMMDCMPYTWTTIYRAGVSQSKRYDILMQVIKLHLSQNVAFNVFT